MKVVESRSFSINLNINATAKNTTPAGVGLYQKSKSGKLPRVAVRALSEHENAALRSDMQDARRELAEAFMYDEHNSLTKLRLLRGYSQQQLAKSIGTSQPHIANIEAGKIEPSFSTASKIADALGISMNDIRPLIESARRKHENVC